MKQRHASKHLTGLVGMRGSEFHNTRMDGICKKCGHQAWELDATDLCPCWKLRLPRRRREK